MSENQQEKDQKQQLEENGVIYSINEEEETATIIGYKSRKKTINIPTCLNFESKKYDVTSIKSIQNCDKLDTKETIERIIIPSTITELKEGWCNNASRLNQVKIDPSNPRYRFIEEIMIVGKTSNESNNYENLVFCVRNIKTIKIPNFIDRIDSFAFSRSIITYITIPNNVIVIGKSAFYNCKQLQKVEISKESKLQSIEEDAFAGSLITYITIPNEVRMIGRRAFNNCKLLRNVEISEESKLQTIEEFAFSGSSIISITIPSSATDLKEGWYFDALELK